MWQKYFLTFLLFYLLFVLQNSFFVHYNFFGAVPDLVFIAFFTATFFEIKNNFYYIIFSALLAGFFLDVFSGSFLGASMALLIAIGFIIKKVQQLLAVKQNDSFPIFYFLPLFFISIAVYDAVLGALGGYPLQFNLNLSSAAWIVYNLAFSGAAFWLYKFFLASKVDTRQLPLFR